MTAAHERGLLDTSTVILLGRITDPASLPDELIAATAIVHGVPLYTCNPDDFSGIDDLELRPVPHPDH